MALRIYWAGNTRGFILSAGGFHPQYTPDPGFNVSNMKRLSMKLDYSILKLSLESYFAVTSNTVQFGAKLELKIGWDSVGIHGELYFNVLFQFKPFYFMADIGVKVAAKLGKITLLSISLEFALSGPAQWNAKGKAEFKILFIKFKVNFNKTWGKSAAVEQRQLIVLLPQFRDNYLDETNRNWKITSGDIIDGLVEIIKFDEGELVMQPSDRISFSQDLLPLEKKIIRYGEAIPSDIKEITLKSLIINDGEPITEGASGWEQTTSYFAPTLISKLDDNSKLKAPSFEKMKAGFSLTASCVEKDGGNKGFGTNFDERIEEDWESWIAYIEWVKLKNQSESTSEGGLTPKIPITPGIGVQIPTPGTLIPKVPVILTTQKPIITTGIAVQTMTSVKLVRQLQPGTNIFYLSSGLIRYKETAALRQLDLKIAKLPSARPSLRRSATGFQRHTVKMESKLNRNMTHLIEQLDLI
jgi:hypothetical protein